MPRKRMRKKKNENAKVRGAKGWRAREMWSPREIFSRLPKASRDTNDYRIFGVNAKYEHRSSRENVII